MGVVGDAWAKSWSLVHGRPTPHIRHSSKQPPSGGYAAISPKGEALKSAVKQTVVFTMPYALDPPLSRGQVQLAQAKGLLGWNDESIRGKKDCEAFAKSEAANFFGV